MVASLVIRFSPDNLGHSAPLERAPGHVQHSAFEVGTPKMPGEPPRVQPSKKVAAHWDHES
jgi:hypothetical protein